MKRIIFWSVLVAFILIGGIYFASNKSDYVSDSTPPQIKNIVVTSQNDELFDYPYRVTYEVTGLKEDDEVIGNLASVTNPDEMNGVLMTTESNAGLHPFDKPVNYVLKVT